MRNFQALNYWGKDSDAMDAYVADPKTGAIYIDPNTTPLWSPSIPVNFLFEGYGPGRVALRSLYASSVTGALPDAELGPRRCQRGNPDDSCMNRW